MTLTDQDFEYLERNWKRFPFKTLASKYQLSEIELLKTLRQRGIITDIQPVELQYIKENIRSMPADVIQSNLGLTSTQFSQICQKVLKIKRVKSLEEWTIKEVIQKTKWLIEEKLRMEVDDFLPRKITNTHFVKNDLYGCIKFALHHKKKDEYYQNFSAVAFLVCHTYPDMYRPFQFRHSKTNKYFCGRGGRKNLINGVRWVLERKLGLKPENFEILKSSKYFLRTTDLQFYGVGPHWYIEHFANKQELINELAKIYVTEEDSSPGHSKHLRQQLISANIPTDKCYIRNCYYDDEYGIQIHHIIPKEYRHMIKIDIHSVHNLIPLCPNHHEKAKKFEWKQLLNETPEQWREMIDKYLCKKGERLPAPNTV